MNFWCTIECFRTLFWERSCNYNLIAEDNYNILVVCSLSLVTRKQVKLCKGWQQIPDDSHLSYSDYPADWHDSLAFQYVIDGVKDPKIKKFLEWQLLKISNWLWCMLWKLKQASHKDSIALEFPWCRILVLNWEKWNKIYSISPRNLAYFLEQREYKNIKLRCW